MGTINATRKDSVKVKLCAVCQLEVEAGDLVCTNCGHTLHEQQKTMALEPIEENISRPSVTSTNASRDSVKNTNLSTHRFSHQPHGRLANRLAGTFTPFRIAITSLLIITCAIIVVSTIYPGKITAVMASPFLQDAIDKNQNFHNALLFYHEKNGRWPETVASLDYKNLLTKQQGFYFVLTTQGDYYQVLTSPFFLKGKIIHWHQNSSKSVVGWNCTSTDFSMKDKNCYVD